jgi:hypothetical protein
MNHPTVSIEQAGLNQLSNWLTSNLTDCRVFSEWPSAEVFKEDKVISIIQAGIRQDEYTDPNVVGTETIHGEISPIITAANAVNQSSAIALLSTCQQSYSSHIIEDITIHQAADSINILTLPTPVTLQDAYDVATEMLAILPEHFISSIAHEETDTQTNLISLIVNSVPTLIIAVNKIKNALNAHYATKIYLWMIKCCRLPVQLDIWSNFNAGRDEMISELEPALNANPYDTAGFGYPSSEPVRNGCIFQLSDGWLGTVDFDFNEPTVSDTNDENQQRQFRATYRGFSDFSLYIKAQSPRLNKVTLKNYLDSITETLDVSL